MKNLVKFDLSNLSLKPLHIFFELEAYTKLVISFGATAALIHDNTNASHLSHRIFKSPLYEILAQVSSTNPSLFLLEVSIAWNYSKHHSSLAL